MMKRTGILFAILVVLLIFSVRAYSQSVETTEVICLFNKKAPQVMSAFAVPFGAQHKKEVVWRKSAPEGFHAVLALMQVVNVAPCPLRSGQEATLSIRAIRLIERDPAGVETVVSEVTDFRGQTRPFRLTGNSTRVYRAGTKGLPLDQQRRCCHMRSARSSSTSLSHLKPSITAGPIPRSQQNRI